MLVKSPGSDQRVVLLHQSFAIFCTSSGVLQAGLDPFLRDHQRRMRDTSRPDLEASALELILRVDLSEVFPSRCLAVACGDGLDVRSIPLIYSLDGARPALRHNGIGAEWRTQTTGRVAD